MYVIGFLFILYLIPPFVFRIHGFIFPQLKGRSIISDAKVYSPWWGGHQVQLLYIAFPAFEAALRLFPGFYSAWLRLWGAKVGRRVYWTPRVEILDRNLMDIGDEVVFGHRVVCVSHVIDQTSDGSLLLYVKPIQIGDGVFIGAGSSIGPGCVIEAGVRLDAFSMVKLNEKRSLNRTASWLEFSFRLHWCFEFA